MADMAIMSYCETYAQYGSKNVSIWIKESRRFKSKTVSSPKILYFLVKSIKKIKPQGSWPYGPLAPELTSYCKFADDFLLCSHTVASWILHFKNILWVLENGLNGRKCRGFNFT
jgi:hypothetical protein